MCIYAKINRATGKTRIFNKVCGITVLEFALN